jgi:hypothetical protein
MERFIVIQEKVVGQRNGNFVVKDSSTHTVLARFADKSEAEGIAFEANKKLQGSQECMGN